MHSLRFNSSCSPSQHQAAASPEGGTLPLHHHTPPYDGSFTSVTFTTPMGTGFCRRMSSYSNPESTNTHLQSRLACSEQNRDYYNRTVGRLYYSDNDDSSSKYCNPQTFTNMSVDQLHREAPAIIEKNNIDPKNLSYSTKRNNGIPMPEDVANPEEPESLAAHQEVSKQLPVKEKPTASDSLPEKGAEMTKGGTKGDGQNSPDVKPTLSYIGLIAKAIMGSAQSRLSLGSIYCWIEDNYPYYRNRGQGWRNSVRHNLSLNDCFIKAGRCEDGKGNYWAIHPANLQDFLRGDFRQRRRSRRRGRRKDTELGMFQMAPSAYLGPVASSIPPGVAFNSQPPLNSLYSPYTEAERRAYRLDEALLRQSMNNPFVKWYNGANGPYHGASPNSAMYPSSISQWQAYPDGTPPTMYQFAGFSATR